MEDAGYAKEEIDAFIPIWQSGNKSESMRLLSKQRKVLLQSIHKNQAELECLESLLCSAPCPDSNRQGKKRNRKVKDSAI